MNWMSSPKIKSPASREAIWLRVASRRSLIKTRTLIQVDDIGRKAGCQGNYIYAVAHIFTHPLTPSQTYTFFILYYFLFERGRDFERGLRPLSLLLPSPSKIKLILLNVTGWRGDKGVR